MRSFFYEKKFLHSYICFRYILLKLNPSNAAAVRKYDGSLRLYHHTSTDPALDNKNQYFVRCSVCTLDIGCRSMNTARFLALEHSTSIQHRLIFMTLWNRLEVDPDLFNTSEFVDNRKSSQHLTQLKYEIYLHIAPDVARRAHSIYQVN